MFDKDALEIKQLLKDIGDLITLIHREQNKNFYLMIVTLSVIHFSLQDDYNNEKVINWKNKLRFKINHNMKKEFITLQLGDILTPKKIEAEDSKVTNISILSLAESKMQIKDEFIIEGFQNFEQCSKINPISVRIIDPDIQTK